MEGAGGALLMDDDRAASPLLGHGGRIVPRMTSDGLEQALATIEARTESTLRAEATVSRELKKARKAAAAGQVRELKRALEAAGQLAKQAAEAAADLRDRWTFDEERHLAGGGFTKEVLALAAEAGVAAFEEDQRILAYPSIMRILPAETAIEIDKKRDRAIRPSVVVAKLQALQDRPPRFKAEAFLEALVKAYDLAAASRGRARGATVKLTEVYEVLTMFPGQAREYSKQEFARDLYLLDQSRVTKTKSGRTLSLPASTLTKTTPVFTTVTKKGQQKVYAGISFS